MPNREPPGPKNSLPDPPSPAAPPADFELAEDALSLLDLDPKAAQAPEAAPGSKVVASTRHAGTVPQPIIASELLPIGAGSDAGQAQSAKRRLRAWVAGAAAVASSALAVAHFGLWPHLGLADGGHRPRDVQPTSRIADLLPKAPRTSQPTAPQLLSQVHAPQPVALPAPIVTPLTLATVDALDGASLAALGPKPGPNEPEALDLWAWAQCRRVLAMGDASARPAL